MLEFYWHIHDRILVEPLTEPIENRIAYINKYKPAREVETRLRLLKPVRGALPLEVLEAGRVYHEAACAEVESWRVCKEGERAYEEAWRIYVEAQDVHDEAASAYAEALRDCAPAVEALHKEECPGCPWDGESIWGDEG